MARLLIWHGYLLGGTGSNIYAANVARAWRDAGHEVVLMCQEAHPETLPFVDEVFDMRADTEIAHVVTDAAPSEAGGWCRVVRTDIGSLLPVYLVDQYERFEQVKRFVDCTENELSLYADRYHTTMQAVLERWPVEGALLNHVVMGPPVLRSALDAARVPYSVKIHGSELEYCIADDERFIAPAREGLVGAVRVLAGSDHIARRVCELLGEECCGDRIEIVPPGVDLQLFVPTITGTDRQKCHQQLLTSLKRQIDVRPGRDLDAENRMQISLADSDLVSSLAGLEAFYDERGTDTESTHGIEGIDPLTSGPIVTYVGKMIRQKGVHLLIAAMPLVVLRVPDVRCVLVGFGKLRETLGALVAALSGNERAVVEQLIARGLELDGPPQAMTHLEQFFRDLHDAGDLDSYYEAATALDHRVTWVGQVDHSVLSKLWPLSTVSVVPSIAPEAFGMVSAEAAACGSLPLVAHHSGLADVADAIADDYPEPLQHLVSFPTGSSTAVRDLADRIAELCLLPAAQRSVLTASARATVEREWSWNSIAERIADPFLAARQT